MVQITLDLCKSVVEPAKLDVYHQYCKLKLFRVALVNFDVSKPSTNQINTFIYVVDFVFHTLYKLE